MKLVRSDSPEAARSIGSGCVRASRYEPVALVALLPNLGILVIGVLVGFLVSMRVAAWISVSAFLAWNAWVIWRTRSPHLIWVIRACAERVCIRIFVGFGRAWRRLDTPDVIILETSEIALLSIRTVEVFLGESNPQIVEWLLIEPTQEVAEMAFDQIPSFLADVRRRDFWMPYLSERVYWAHDERRFAIGWKRCSPALRIFLKQIVRECPSIAVGPEERSELDFSWIWHDVRESLNPEQRRMLVEARRLGFGPNCTQLLNRYRGMSFREIGAFWTEIQREEAGTVR